MTTRTLLLLCLSAALIYGGGCSKSDRRDDVDSMSSATPFNSSVVDLTDGIWSVDFASDSPMFRLNETCGGKAELTVVGCRGSLQLVMPSQNFVSVFVGRAQDAANASGLALIKPTTRDVLYPDGLTETVNVFDIPLPVLGQEFDLAIIGKKGVWYDHHVSVSNPVYVGPLRSYLPPGAAPAANDAKNADATDASGTAGAPGSSEPQPALTPGEYLVPVEFEGGTGRTKLVSPAKAVVDADGAAVVTLVWGSRFYDYMLVGDVKLEPTTTEPGATFEVPVANLAEPLPVTADSVAMSEPHEIEYTLRFGTPVPKTPEDVPAP